MLHNSLLDYMHCKAIIFTPTLLCLKPENTLKYTTLTSALTTAHLTREQLLYIRDLQPPDRGPEPGHGLSDNGHNGHPLNYFYVFYPICQ